MGTPEQWPAAALGSSGCLGWPHSRVLFLTATPATLKDSERITGEQRALYGDMSEVKLCQLRLWKGWPSIHPWGFTGTSMYKRRDTAQTVGIKQGLVLVLCEPKDVDKIRPDQYHHPGLLQEIMASFLKTSELYPWYQVETVILSQFISRVVC